MMTLRQAFFSLPMLVLTLICGLLAQETPTEERRGSRMERNRKIWHQLTAEQRERYRTLDHREIAAPLHPGIGPAGAGVAAWSQLRDRS